MNMPDYYGVFLEAMIENGAAALIVQGYEEVNKKKGVQWEISRLIENASTGDKFYSVMVVGDKPVDLKARTVGATGGGAIARVYKIEPEDFTVSGNGDTWYNLHFGVGTQPETKIYGESDITFITDVSLIAAEANKKAADVYAITNTQNQGKGVISRPFNSGRILPAGSMVLFEIESFDTGQEVFARIEMYEGILDHNI